MSPRISEYVWTIDTGIDVSMGREGSMHQPIHVLVRCNNQKTRVKIYSDRDPVIIEYAKDILSSKDKSIFEDWVYRNIDDIAYDWEVFQGNANGPYRTMS